jgi:acyl-CoA thioester hydrolase
MAEADQTATLASSYRYWVDERVRFADLDLLGHVNNKAYCTYAESCRAAFLRHTGMWDGESGRQGVVIRLEINYLQELHYPAELRVGLRVLKLGASSFTVGLGIFSGERCVATAITVIVRIDAQTRAKVTLSDDERGALAPYVG